MAMIRPSSDLRNKYGEISEFCNKHHEPVYITKNGSGDLVVLSNRDYEDLCAKLELYRCISEGLDDVRQGRIRAAGDVFADIERKYNFE